LVANRFVNLTFNPFRKGNDDTLTSPGSERGCGHTLCYHNTLWTAYEDSDGASQGFHPWRTNQGQGNSAFVNNIFAGTGDRYIQDAGGGPGPTAVYRRPIRFEKNAFYTTASNPTWSWHDEEETTEALWMLNLVNPDPDTDSVTMIGNVYGTNPFPSGINGALNSALQDIATSIDGISEIAGDASGNLIIVPLDLGYFPRWANQ
jgi:hypothetical protein